MAASGTWQEIEQAVKENRREIVLTGADISKRIESSGLDPAIYKVSLLNFLEISRTGLDSLSDELSGLHNLTNLVLHSNKLKTIPSSIGELTKLKQLDLSRNQLVDIPDELAQLPELHTLNVSCNEIEEFPDVDSLPQLHVFDVSHNQLESLPNGLEKLSLLAQVNASSNKIRELPSEVCGLPALRSLDLSDNVLQQVPAELSECHKLKELNLKGNKLKDRRLGKMVDQCQTKSVLDYLRTILEKESGGKGKGGKKGKKKKGKAAKEEDDVEEIAKNLFNVLHFPTESGLTVRVTQAVMGVRPYIVCCIVRNLNFTKSVNMFKRFITLQTKLHETICQKRQTATIATHDLKAIKGQLTYDARPPGLIKLVPLFKQKEISAGRLMSQLVQEAEAYRKEKKRNTFSGIHKYLDLIIGKELYPCLTNSDDVVISFPPITNCEITKVSKETTDILIEVTSSTNLDTCKTVIDHLLTELLEMGVGEAQGSTVAEGAAAVTREDGDGLSFTSNQQLVVEQVKIVDHEGALKVLYPARNDLQSDAFRVVRDYE